MPSPKLSICIPTYNRCRWLTQCLEYVLPQIGQLPAEVVVIDNASPDRTPAVVAEFAGRYPCLRHYRNTKNLGYAGNQVKCFEYATGDYVAILCDDDVYLEGAVETILRKLSEREHSLVALNYQAYIKNPHKIYYTNLAPEQDVQFDRALDIINHPSVGHFSGLIFNTTLARRALEAMLAKRDVASFEKIRGVLVELPARTTTDSQLPAHFIGKRLVAARVPFRIDYDLLHHICLDYLDLYLNLFKEGVITKADLAPKTDFVLNLLPKALLRCGGYLNSKELARITERLTGLFHDDPRFRRSVSPTLTALRSSVLRALLRCMMPVYRGGKLLHMLARS